jgi:hypothetical protein
VIECIVEEDEVDEPEDVCKDDSPAIKDANIKVGTKVKLISSKSDF